MLDTLMPIAPKDTKPSTLFQFQPKIESIFVPATNRFPVLLPQGSDLALPTLQGR
jgi:hypothetical protein